MREYMCSVQCVYMHSAFTNYAKKFFGLGNLISLSAAIQRTCCIEFCHYQTRSWWKVVRSVNTFVESHLYIFAHVILYEVLSWLSTEHQELAKWIEYGKAANCIHSRRVLGLPLKLQFHFCPYTSLTYGAIRC